MKNLKMFVLSMLLGFCLFNLAEVNIFNPSDNLVYADIPTIEIGSNGKLNVGSINAQTPDAFFNKALKEYRKVIIFVSGIATLSMILFFILNFINLGKSQGNPQERQKAINGLIFTGVATACLGSVTTVVAMFYNML